MQHRIPIGKSSSEYHFLPPTPWRIAAVTKMANPRRVVRADAILRRVRAMPQPARRDPGADGPSARQSQPSIAVGARSRGGRLDHRSERRRHPGPPRAVSLPAPSSLAPRMTSSAGMFRTLSIASQATLAPILPGLKVGSGVLLPLWRWSAKAVAFRRRKERNVDKGRQESFQSQMGFLTHEHAQIGPSAFSPWPLV